ncbi:MAG TPA: patatin-like phospholipase family protein [Acidimicrobiales bacterium]|nr:patatin-like phospholipase family protein [Acidimicrobiales bacterium]
MPEVQPFPRSPQDQQAFDQAKVVLKQHDTYVDPVTGVGSMPADLVLEGGGVKGIGLVGAMLVLDEAGYRFPRIAGTSSGAIAASLAAAIQQAGRSLSLLRQYLGTVDYLRFEDKSLIRRLTGGLGSAAHLLLDMGLFSGDYLVEWLSPILADLGVTSFGQLEIPPGEDPGASIPEGQRYRLLVLASDITRRTLVRMPWDYPIYGLPAGEQSIVAAVRASMSIPFFFEPVRMKTKPSTSPEYGDWPGGTVTLVDGGMLSNFPLQSFDRADQAPSRWPTFGIKLSARQIQMSADRPAANTVGEAIDCLRTMITEWDRYHLDTEAARSTIFVDCGTINSTDFGLTLQDQQQLFDSGCRAATQFLVARAATLSESRSPSGGTQPG